MTKVIWKRAASANACPGILKEDTESAMSSHHRGDRPSGCVFERSCVAPNERDDGSGGVATRRAIAKCDSRHCSKFHDCCTLVLPSAECDCVSHFIWYGVDTGDDDVYRERYKYIFVQQKNKQEISTHSAAWEDTHRLPAWRQYIYNIYRGQLLEKKTQKWQGDSMSPTNFLLMLPVHGVIYFLLLVSPSSP